MAASAHPILSFTHALFRAVEQVDLVQSGTLAHLHDLNTQVPHGLGCAGVLHALTPVTGLLHIGLALHFSCPDAADHDVDMDISRMVVSVRVGADDSRMTGKVLFAEVQAEGLCLFHRQPIFGCIPRVEADDILVTLDVIRVVVLVVLPVCQQAGHCKRGFAAFKGVQNVRFPQLGSALFIQNFLAGKFIVLVNQIGLSGRVVRIFRGDMLQRCHTVYPELSRR